MPPDSATIDGAILSLLSGDAALRALLPDGVYFDEAPPNLHYFALVSLFKEDDAPVFGERAIEDCLYVIQAVTFGTSASKALDAAARIDALMEAATLTAAGFECMSVSREERIRYPEIDAIDPSVRWQHVGAHYRVSMALDWGQ